MYWKVEFFIFTVSDGLNANGSTSMTLKKNQKPYNGSCSIDLLEGFVMETHFSFNCENWADHDGFVVKYEYFGK